MNIFCLWNRHGVIVKADRLCKVNLKIGDSFKEKNNFKVYSVSLSKVQQLADQHIGGTSGKDYTDSLGRRDTKKQRQILP